MPEKPPMPDKTEEGIRDKRRAIVMAAREIFARQGYEATTIAEIANAAEVAVGTVYLYFPNKREVYVAASISLSDEIADALLQPEILASPLKQVPRALIESTFQTCRANDKFMSLFQVNLQTQAEITLHQKDHTRIIQTINILLLHYVAQGDMAPFDTEMYAKILFNLVNSVLYDCFCLESGASEERYREQTIEIVERIFFGPALHP